jgi:hypothetical protein
VDGIALFEMQIRQHVKLSGTQLSRPMHLFQKRRDIHALLPSDRSKPAQRQAWEEGISKQGCK